MAKPCVVLALVKMRWRSEWCTQRSAIEAILRGGVDDELIRNDGPTVASRCPKLIQSVGKNWSPSSIELSGLKQISSEYGDMIVNAYVIWSEISRKCMDI